MASAFSLEQGALEDRVARLVGSGQLGDLRVDLVDHALRSSTSSKAAVSRRARAGQFMPSRCAGCCCGRRASSTIGRAGPGDGAGGPRGPARPGPVGARAARGASRRARGGDARLRVSSTTRRGRRRGDDAARFRGDGIAAGRRPSGGATTGRRRSLRFLAPPCVP